MRLACSTRQCDCSAGEGRAEPLPAALGCVSVGAARGTKEGIVAGIAMRLAERRPVPKPLLTARESEAIRIHFWWIVRPSLVVS